MLTTTDERALLAAIIAAPDDDLPRLAYADFLEETASVERVPCPTCSPHAGQPCQQCTGNRYVPVRSGFEWVSCWLCEATPGKCPPGYHPERDPASGRHEGGWTNCKTCNGGGRESAGAGFMRRSDGKSERAEFIRAQVELANAPRNDSGHCSCCGVHGEQKHREGCGAGRLKERADTLLAMNWLEWITPPAPDSLLGLGQSFREVFAFRRGFVESVRCSLDQWRRHGPAVVREQPVTRVEIVGKSPTGYPALSTEKAYWRWFSGERADGTDGNGADELPSWLWPVYAERNSFGREHPTREAAIAGLSDALLAWAKAQGKTPAA